VSIKNFSFWNATPCNLVHTYQYFGRSCVSRNDGSKQFCSVLSYGNSLHYSFLHYNSSFAIGIVRLKRGGTRAETRFRLSAKRTSPFKSAGVSVQSTTGSRGVRISGSNARYTAFRVSVGVLATHSIHQFLLHFPSRASPCAIRFQTPSTFSYQMHSLLL